jgi:hypothetical protein
VLPSARGLSMEVVGNPRARVADVAWLRQVIRGVPGVGVMTGRPACRRFNYCRYHVAHHKNNQFVELADLVMAVLAALASAAVQGPRCWYQQDRLKIARGKTLSSAAVVGRQRMSLADSSAPRRSTCPQAWAIRSGAVVVEPSSPCPPLVYTVHTQRNLLDTDLLQVSPCHAGEHHHHHPAKKG